MKMLRALPSPAANFFLKGALLAAAATVAAALSPSDARAEGAPQPSAQVDAPSFELPGQPADPLPLLGPRGPRSRGITEPVAIAQDGRSWTESADLDEASYDIAGSIVVDVRDDLDASAILDLAMDFGLRFTPSDLEPQTRIEIASVEIDKMGEIIAKLSSDPRVEFAEPLAYVRASFVPNDPLMGEQWHMERIGAGRAWDFATGRGVTVAVVDTGIACEDHPPFTKGSDLASTECLPGWNFVNSTPHANDDQGHGTHVAGTIAQSTNNGLGAAGVAFHARL